MMENQDALTAAIQENITETSTSGESSEWYTDESNDDEDEAHHSENAGKESTVLTGQELAPDDDENLPTDNTRVVYLPPGTLWYGLFELLVQKRSFGSSFTHKQHLQLPSPSNIAAVSLEYKTEHG